MYRGEVEIFSIGNDDMKRIKELMNKYRNVPMDFADACLVYVAERLKINEIVTIDKDFLIYKIGGKKNLKLSN